MSRLTPLLMMMMATQSATPPGGVTVVGTSSGHTTTTSTTIVLPAGCAAGDYAVIAVSRSSAVTITPPSGAVDLLSDYVFYTTTLIAHVYGYTLTSTDITNGSISFSSSGGTANWYELVVVHSASGTPSVDVTGSAATASPNNTHPINCPANSVTTTGANELVLAFAFVGLASTVSVTYTTPSGWTFVDATSVSYSYQMAVYSLVQSSAGATGNASITATSSANTRGAGIQIAFKP